MKWAEWLIDAWDIFDAWMDGAHVCDPTAGQGAFAVAMLRLARRHGASITPERLSRLTLIEKYPSHLARFAGNVKRDFGIDFPTSQLYCKDIILDPHEEKYDALIGNPPWANFTDLPDEYKARVKPCFLIEGLVLDKQKMLLGSSRIDIAALILKIVLGRLLKKNGVGCFYLPTSLFFGGEAHSGFRNYKARRSSNAVGADRHFAVEAVYEFTASKVFEGIGTSYCCASIRVDSPQTFPVSYFREIESKWVEHKAQPLKGSTDPWRVARSLEELKIGAPLELRLPPEQMPRQGVNTCGANGVFLFDGKPYLPDRFLYPLATKELWRQQTLFPRKWILLPYDPHTGKPLTWAQIDQHDALRKHLKNAQETLQARKGSFLRAAMKRGHWWTLLGVGPYAFAPFKVIWEAYGKNQFHPIILNKADGQAWQGNQSMHAFIPCWTERGAQRIKAALETPELTTLLRQLGGAGKRNWAQPGKIKKILALH